MAETIGCATCGMVNADPRAFHPYAACLMMLATRDGNKVEANLRAVVPHRRTPHQHTGGGVMADIIIRATSTGYMVAEPLVREYGDGYAITGKRARWYSTATAAISAALDRLPPPMDPDGSEGSQAPSAPPLHPQTARVLKYMKAHDGMTALDAARMDPPIMRLSARVHELRAIYGEGSVETVRQGRDQHAKYVWARPRP